MQYKIFDKSGNLVNTIIAEENFVMPYCQNNDWLFEEEIIEKPSKPEPSAPEPTEIEQLRADVDFIAVMTGVEL